MSLFTSSVANAITPDVFLSVEDTPEILEFRCARTGMLIWPNVRLMFLRTIMGNLFFSSSGSFETPVSHSPRRAAGALARASVHNFIATATKSIRADLFFNTEAVGDVWTGAEWYNRYVDPFMDVVAHPGTVLLDMFEWNWREPRHSRLTYYHAPIQALSHLHARRPDSIAQKQAEAMVALLQARAKELLGWTMDPDQCAHLVARFAAKIRMLPARYHAYRKLLKRVRPRVLIGSSGCYGIHAPLLSAARDLGIVTAEYQHGAISEGHDAYNFAATIVKSDDYRSTLPQYLLTYGDWWGQHIGAPVEKVTIGNPARTRKLAGMSPPARTRNKILLLSDGVEFSLYLELARTIASAIGGRGLDVVVRPHPIERSSVIAEFGLGVDNVSFDVNPDIYDTFLSAQSVISEVSTGLFEAVGLVDRIVIIESAKARFCYPNHPFTIAKSVKDIVDIVTSSDRGKPLVRSEQLWAPDWENNFRKFIIDKVGLNGE